MKICNNKLYFVFRKNVLLIKQSFVWKQKSVSLAKQFAYFENPNIVLTKKLLLEGRILFLQKKSVLEDLQEQIKL